MINKSNDKNRDKNNSILIVINGILTAWDKSDNREKQIWHVQVKLKGTKMLKSQEYKYCHYPLSQEWINGRYRTFNQ